MYNIPDLPSLPIQIYTRRSRLLSPLSICAMLVFGDAFLIFGGGDKTDNNTYSHVMNWFGLVFFGACFVVILVRIIKPKLLIIVTKEGIIKNPNLLVKWNEIQDFDLAAYYESRYNSQQLIVVKLKDPNNYIEKFKSGRGLMKRFGSPFTINVRWSGIENETFLIWLERYWNENKQE